MSQTSTVTTVTWPPLRFGPVNLWSLPADWKRDLVAGQRPALPPQNRSLQVNPHIQRLLAHR